jgi:hypothetical protein
VTINERASSAIAQIVERAELLRKLGPDLLAIIDTDARNSSTRDGYPGGGAQDGPRGNSELTPTEAGASARMGRRMTDEYHREVIRALDSLEVALRALKTVTTTPERIRNLQTQPEELAKGNENWCSYVQRLAMPEGGTFPYDEKWDTYRRSDLWGTWPEPRPVCLFVYQWAEALRWHPVEHRLPTAQNCLDYLRGERKARPRVDPKKGAAA